MVIQTQATMISWGKEDTVKRRPDDGYIWQTGLKTTGFKRNMTKKCQTISYGLSDDCLMNSHKSMMAIFLKNTVFQRIVSAETIFFKV